MILVSFLILFTYIGLVCLKHGIPETISDSYYLGGKGPWFSAVMLAISGLLVPEAISISSGWGLVLALSGIIGLILTGLFPEFRPKGLGRTLHLLGARWSGLVAQISVMLLGFPWLMVTWMIPALMFIHVWREKPESLGIALDKIRFIFWVEIVCFINLFLGLLLK